VVLGLLLKVVTGFSIFSLLKYLAREYLLIVSTSSSETVLLAHWVEEIDRDQVRRVLSGENPFDEATMLDDDHGHGSERAQAADPRTAAPPGDAADTRTVATRADATV